jgi:hypothetical protein
MLKTIIGTSTCSMGKGKVQETMASSTPLLMGSSSLVVVITSSLRKLVATTIGYTCEPF